MLKFLKSLANKLPGRRRSSQNDDSWSIKNDEDGDPVYTVRDKDLRKLHKAAWYGFLDKNKMVAKQDLNAFDKCHRTPLHLACCQGYKSIVKNLLALNVHTNIRDKESKTPLMKAVECGHTDVVEVLLTHNVDGEARLETGDTPLHLAIRYRHVPIIKVLLKAGTNPNLKNKEGKTPLHYAILKQDFKIIAILLENKSDVNAIDSNQRTALMVAAYLGLYKIMNLLLMNGARISVRDAHGLSAIDYTEVNGHKKCYVFLMKEELCQLLYSCKYSIESRPGIPTNVSKRKTKVPFQIIPDGSFQFRRCRLSPTYLSSPKICVEQKAMLCGNFKPLVII